MIRELKEKRNLEILQELADVVCEETHIPLQFLKGPSVRREYSYTRFMFYWIATVHYGVPTPATAEFLNKTVASVRGGLRKVKPWVENKTLNPKWNKTFNKILYKLCIK